MIPKCYNIFFSLVRQCAVLVGFMLVLTLPSVFSSAAANICPIAHEYSHCVGLCGFWDWFSPEKEIGAFDVGVVSVSFICT